MMAEREAAVLFGDAEASLPRLPEEERFHPGDLSVDQEIPSCRPRRVKHGTRIASALIVSAVLHAMPIALLLSGRLPLLLGTEAAGGSGWERMAPVVWQGDATFSGPVSVEVEPFPPPATPALPKEEIVEDKEEKLPDLREASVCLPSLEIPGLPEIAELQAPRAEKGWNALDEKALLPPPKRKSQGKPAASTEDVAGGQGTQIQVPLLSSGKNPGGSDDPVQVDGQSVGSVGEVPAAVWNPQPVYPAGARKAGCEGVVEVELSIAGNGHVAEAWIITSSGHTLLDQAAVEALRRWRFASRARTGAAIRLVQKVVFRLGG